MCIRDRFSKQANATFFAVGVVFGDTMRRCLWQVSTVWIFSSYSSLIVNFYELLWIYMCAGPRLTNALQYKYRFPSYCELCHREMNAVSFTLFLPTLHGLQFKAEHNVGFPCFDIFLQNCTKGRYTPMSFGFKRRCCTVVESYTVNTYLTQTLNCLVTGHYLWRGSYCFFLVQR